ncbi:unnamed protein product [Adineta ricciae]|uniref:F-box domain-containing protein n=1 Tax=Adineta ricciae TaxID=249248 RepID=A0A815TZ09_ADIRI|nr:unnamed protein product [Adineta ricciae]
MRLNHLPDEILLLILKELNNIEVLYSFHDVHPRFNGITRDPIFTSHLNFVKYSRDQIINKFSFDFIDEFSSQILPSICEKIKWINIESSFMKSILSGNRYPNLYGLGLYNVDEKMINLPSNDENLFQNQITSLVIGIDPEKKNWTIVENICNNLFPVMNHLIDLTFCELSYKTLVRLLIDVPSPKFSSSTLLTLNIKAQTFNDCLYIPDGRFQNLQSLSIDLTNIDPSSRQIENQKKVPNLKCFNLSCLLVTWLYNELIVPLLHRMTNLEKLGLYLETGIKEKFIDGNTLKKDILDHLIKINHFDFDIYSLISLNNQTNYPLQQDIQSTFQGGSYPFVRIVSLYDERPFEHDFFLRISLAFPLMNRLTVTNQCSQKRKQSMDINENLEIIRYDHLLELDIGRCHDDYTEQFLLHTKTFLHDSISLIVDAESLERVTQNFTRNQTRTNCEKVNEIFFYGTKKYSIESLRDYFPFVEID